MVTAAEGYSALLRDCNISRFEVHLDKFRICSQNRTDLDEKIMDQLDTSVDTRMVCGDVCNKRADDGIRLEHALYQIP